MTAREALPPRSPEGRVHVHGTSRRRAPEASAPNGLDRTERIRALAYSYFVERGGGDGHELEDWLRAEAQIQRSEPPISGNNSGHHRSR